MFPKAGAFLDKSLLASFCLQYTSNEFFYRPCNFHFNILSSFEIIAKTLSVALEVSLSIDLEKKCISRWTCCHMTGAYIYNLTVLYS